jgi:mRNA interferase HicA
MPDTRFVKGSEFLRKVQAEANRNGVSFRWVASHGKGSHGTVYYGAKQTTLKDLKKDIGKGLLSAMKKQLGVSF